MGMGTRSGTCDEHTMSVRTQACTRYRTLQPHPFPPPNDHF